MTAETVYRARRKVRPAACVVLAALALGLTGCGNEGSMTSTETPGEPAQALFAFYTDIEGQNQVARIDPVTLEVLETNHVGTGASGGKQKSYFYENRFVWMAQGANVYALHPESLENVGSRGGPYVQGNRSGEVGLAQVNNVGVASTGMSAQSTVFNSELTSLLQRTSFTDEELQRVDLCALHNDVTQAARIMAMGVTPQDHLDPADVRVHNMGYNPVGNETSPDGRLLMHGVRQGDHMLFIDTDPESETFGMPVRFVYARHGFVKDQNNAVVATFNSVYDAAGGTAPGNLRYPNRANNASPGEADPNTYVEPCDSTMLRNAQGVAWSWTVDVDGDTITGVNVDAINSGSPEVYNHPVSVVRKRNLNTASQSGNDSVGPWMGSLNNRNTGANEFLFFIEYEGENSEGVWDITDPANPVEVQRMFNTLADVVDDEDAAPFVNGQLYEVTVSFATTGGPDQVVLYEYVSLPGDNMTGGGTPGLTTAYLQKVDSIDPGPNYLLNGLTGRAFTSAGTMSRLAGSGEDTVIFSDEVWLTTTQGADGFDIVNLRTSPPWRITEHLDHPSGAGHWFGDKYFQTRGGGIDVIDRESRSLVDVINLGAGISAIAFGTYTSTAVAPAPGTGGGAGGGGTGGGGTAPPPNPCG